jgi:hypothetical protein
MISLSPPDPPTGGRLLDAQLHLLDRQVLDRKGQPVTTVDDLELSDSAFEGQQAAGEAPVITALLSGSALATRIFGGRPPSRHLSTIAWSHVAGIGITLTLDVDAEDLDLTWTERWVADHVIGRIPGGRHDPE